MTQKELWYIGLARAKQSVHRAVYLEEHGWDGLMFPDTQCIANDAYIEIAMCAVATKALKFSPGVTNPITRDSSVLASMAATLQEESEGRIRLAIGRGDSAAAYTGREGINLKGMRRYLTELQTYLSGEAIDRGEVESRLRWLPERNLVKVPLDIAGTGPKMIEMAAHLGDGICLGVGGNPERIKAKVALVEEILDRVGRPRDEFTISALLTGTVNDDIQLARDNIRGVVGITARFSGMTAVASADLNESDQKIVSRIAREYRLEDHGRANSLHAKNIPDEYIDRESIVGTPDVATRRLQEIYDIGIDRIWITSGSFDSDPAVVDESVRLLSEKVLPQLDRQAKAANEGE